MRDYSKVSATFWTGATGKALRRRGSEAIVVALYLMTAPGSNMLGLYYQPTLYMAHETGLGVEGASKGLQACIEEGFCKFDPDTEMVWVVEMAGYQIANELKASDKRCAGIQKDYDGLPNCPFLGEFFDRYQGAFHLSKRRGMASPFEAPSKPGTGTGTGAGVNTEAKASGGKPPAELSKSQLWQAAVSLLSAQGMAEAQARAFVGKLAKDYPGDEIVRSAVEGAVSEQPADARAYLKATCQRLAGERSKAGTPDWTAEAL